MSNLSTEKLSDSIATHLMVQISAAKNHGINIFIDDYFMGYIWGFIDGTLSAFEIKFEEQQESCIEVMHRVHILILLKQNKNPNEIHSLFNKSIDEQSNRTNKNFVEGMLRGGNDSFYYVKSKSKESKLPMGLLDHYGHIPSDYQNLHNLVDSLKQSAVYWLKKISLSIRVTI